MMEESNTTTTTTKALMMSTRSLFKYFRHSIKKPVRTQSPPPVPTPTTTLSYTDLSAAMTLRMYKLPSLNDSYLEVAGHTTIQLFNHLDSIAEFICYILQRFLLHLWVLERMIIWVWLERGHNAWTKEWRRCTEERERTECFPYPHPTAVWIMMLGLWFQHGSSVLSSSKFTHEVFTKVTLIIFFCCKISFHSDSLVMLRLVFSLCKLQL